MSLLPTDRSHIKKSSKHMSMQGVAVTKMDELMNYTTTWVNELQATSRQIKHTGSLAGQAKTETLCSGQSEVFKDRVEFNPPSTQTAGLLPLSSLRHDGEWKETITSTIVMGLSFTVH